jgi:hypothetical protein
MTDSIEQPAHYDFGQMEAREIIELAIADITDPVTAYHVATTLKYFLRTSRKGGTEDIAKGCKHAGWALDASRAHDVRKLRDIPPPHYDPDSVAFRHGDIDKVCGLPNSSTTVPSMGRNGACEFTKPPNCTHPMHAVALEMADAAIPNRRSESAWAVTWPRDVSGSCEQSAGPQTEYQTLVGN